MERLAPPAARFPRRRLALTVLLAAAALCAPATASAATRYIDDTGNDTSNTCLNSASPCRSFNRAYQVSSPGDIVMVASGNYGGQSVAEKAGAAAPNVEFRAETGATITLGSVGIHGSYVSITGTMSATGLDVDGAANSAANKPVRSVLIDGMNVDGRNSVSVIGYMRGVNGLTLRNVDIANSNNNSLMLADQDAAAGGVSNVWLDYAVIHDAHLDAGSSAHTECFYAQGIDGLKITNSHFYRCAVMDVFITRWTGTSDDPSNGWIENNVFEAPLAAGNTCCSSNAFHFRNGGEPAPDIDNWDFRYNTFLGALSFGTASENVVKPSGLRVIGNIFSGGTTCRTTNATFSYNLYAGGTCGGVGETSTTASALNAGFVGPTTQSNAGNNFRLTASSPAIDRGNAADFPGTDQDGGLRPSGLKADVGAFEYSSGAPPADSTAPDTSITGAPSSGTSTSASISFTGSDNVGVASFECSLDSGAYATCASPKSYMGLAVGSHTFSVRARDAAGNVDATPATSTWTITAPADTTAPDTSISSAPAVLTASTTATLAFSGTDNVAVAGYECMIDAGAWAACASPKAYSALADGSHTFSVRAKDAAGNVDASPATATWTVDATAPDTSVSGAPASLTTSTSASPAFSSPDGSASFECRIDGGAWAACASPKAYSGLADGTHTFNVRAKDAAGNVDATPATATWTVDTTPPDTSIGSSPSSPTPSTNASLGFSSPDGSASFECRIDGGAWAACASPKAYSGLADGTHTFNVRAKDAAGNVDATPATATWTVDATVPDTTAPDTTITDRPAASTTSTTASVSFTGSDDVGVTGFECRLDGGAWVSCASPADQAGLALGDHAFSVRAKDAAGNVDATPAVATWTVVTPPDTTAPDTALTSEPAASTTSTTATFAFTATEGGSTFECRTDTESWGACASPHVDDPVALGGHTFNVRAEDPAGNIDPTPASVNWSVVAPTPAPAPALDTTIVTKPPALTGDRKATFTLAANVPSPSFDCSLDGAAWKACSATVRYSLYYGTHTFRARAKSAGLVDTTPTSYSWTISRRVRAASYSFDVLSTQESGTTTVQADGAATACSQAGKNGRVAVRITAISAQRSGRRVRISGEVPAFAVDRGNARIRVSVRRGSGWRLLASRRAAVRDGRFTVRAPRARGALKVAAVVRCS